MNVDKIIQILGGTSALQALLNVGPSAISNYRRRQSFPEYARIKIWQALKAHGVDIDPETLSFLNDSIDDPVSPFSSSTPFNAPLMHQTLEKQSSILLIIGGGIAAYKALDLIRRIKEQGFCIKVILTEGGAQFITPLSVGALADGKAHTDLFSLDDDAAMEHIRLAREADLILVAPATANLLARMAHGMANDLATTTLLAADAPVVIAPAMNPFMWSHPATQSNVELLKKRGVHLIAPEDGAMACEEAGTGRLAETQTILANINQILKNKKTNDHALKNKKVLVTAGPTHEPIDQVRYIGNRSSGKQGYAIAATLARHGASVQLISGPVALSAPSGVDITSVETAREMLDASLNALPCDIAICTAAVADWSPQSPHQQKLKKGSSPPNLVLRENPDILASISTHPQHRPRLVIGFAAETHDVVNYACDKRQRKGCDWILANDVSRNIFGSDENEIYFITETGINSWQRMSKQAVASQLVDSIINELSYA